MCFKGDEHTSRLIRAFIDFFRFNFKYDRYLPRTKFVNLYGE